MLNLVRDRWLPVVRADGVRDVVAPWELAAGESPPVDLVPARPDFRAALLEFLVGLLQTVCPPPHERDWLALLAEPPSSETLRQAMEPHVPFFNLFGERPRFMQDYSLVPDSKKAVDVSALLIDAPGGNTLKHNGDFFVKRGRVECLCPACAAMALFTLQAFAPSGGKGHRTSLRGGGPLSTLVRGATLWETVWSNVLPQTATQTDPSPPPSPGPDGLPGAVYPWAAPTRTSEKGEVTRPTDVHFLHAYWAMPRRILLMEEEVEEPVACDLCQAMAYTIVRRYVTRPSGYNYGPTWRHPLSPYRYQGADKPTLAVKGMANIAGYDHWLGVVYSQPDQPKKKGSRILRAACVGHALGGIRFKEVVVGAAGYDMDNMKPLQWCEADFHAISGIADESLEEFREVVDLLVLAADQARRNLLGTLKEVLVGEAGRNQAKIDATRFSSASDRFWGMTEAEFYKAVGKIALAPEFEGTEPIRRSWSWKLIKAAEDIFEEETTRSRCLPQHEKQRVEAGRKLRNFNYKALAKILELPEPERGA